MTVEIERDGELWTLTINRPEVRNAIDPPTAHALAAGFREFDADAEARVAVLAGAGGHFCAGADLKALSEGRSLRVEADGDGPLGPTRLELSKPVIAAVSGFAVAGGFELALWCDLRVVEKSAIFGVFCRRFGVPLVDGGTVRLPRIIGMGRAMDLVLTGRPVDATESLEIGLASRLCDDGKALQTSQALAREIAAFPQSCLRSDRRSVYEQQGHSVADALHREFELGAATIGSGETLDGAHAFKNGAGRHGSFKGD